MKERAKDNCHCSFDRTIVWSVTIVPAHRRCQIGWLVFLWREPSAQVTWVYNAEAGASARRGNSKKLSSVGAARKWKKMLKNKKLTINPSWYLIFFNFYHFYPENVYFFNLYLKQIWRKQKILNIFRAGWTHVATTSTHMRTHVACWWLSPRPPVC